MNRSTRRWPLHVSCAALAAIGIAVIYYPVLRKFGGDGGHEHGAGRLLMMVPFLVAIAGSAVLVEAFLMNAEGDARRSCMLAVLVFAGLSLFVAALGMVGFVWLAWWGKGV